MIEDQLFLKLANILPKKIEVQQKYDYVIWSAVPL